MDYLHDMWVNYQHYFLEICGCNFFCIWPLVTYLTWPLISNETMDSFTQYGLLTFHVRELSVLPCLRCKHHKHKCILIIEQVSLFIEINKLQGLMVVNIEDLSLHVQECLADMDIPQWHSIDDKHLLSKPPKLAQLKRFSTNVFLIWGQATQEHSWSIKSVYLTELCN